MKPIPVKPIALPVLSEMIRNRLRANQIKRQRLVKKIVEEINQKKKINQLNTLPIIEEPEESLNNCLAPESDTVSETSTSDVSYKLPVKR